MTRWETAGLPQLGEVVAAGDCTLAAGEGGVQRDGRVAWLPDLPFSGLRASSFLQTSADHTYQSTLFRDKTRS